MNVHILEVLIFNLFLSNLIELHLVIEHQHQRLAYENAVEKILQDFH